jgi:hypothetical protein
MSEKLKNIAFEANQFYCNLTTLKEEFAIKVCDALNEAVVLGLVEDLPSCVNGALLDYTSFLATLSDYDRLLSLIEGQNEKGGENAI